MIQKDFNNIREAVNFLAQYKDYENIELIRITLY